MVTDWPNGALEAIAGNLEIADGRIRNRLERRHHKAILHSLWADDPADLYPDIHVPVSLIVAVTPGSTVSSFAVKSCSPSTLPYTIQRST